MGHTKDKIIGIISLAKKIWGYSYIGICTIQLFVIILLYRGVPRSHWGRRLGPARLTTTVGCSLYGIALGLLTTWGPCNRWSRWTIKDKGCI